LINHPPSSSIIHWYNEAPPLLVMQLNLFLVEELWSSLDAPPISKDSQKELSPNQFAKSDLAEDQQGFSFSMLFLRWFQDIGRFPISWKIIKWKNFE
jgi:hypothetical protein